MEAKGKLLAKLAEISAFPLVLGTKALDEAVITISSLAPSFGAVNLEAMNETSSMEIKRRLTEAADLPVYHDTQDGLPVLSLAALMNSLKVVEKKMAEIKMILVSSENEALPLVDFFRLAGASDIGVCDRAGAIHKGRPGATNWVKEELAQKTNPRQRKGNLAKILAGSDVLVILSQNIPLVKDLASAMASRPVILNLTDQKADFGQAAVTAGTSPNQANPLNSSLVFPGILRGY